MNYTIICSVLPKLLPVEKNNRINEIKLLDREISTPQRAIELSDGSDAGLCSLMSILELTGKNYSKFFLIYELKAYPHILENTLSAVGTT